MRRLLLAAIAGSAVGLLLFLKPHWPAVTQAVLGGAATVILVEFLQLGVGVRSLLTGIRSDLVQIRKHELEIEKLKEEVTQLRSRIKEPTQDEVIRYGRGEIIQKKNLTGREGKLRG